MISETYDSLADERKYGHNWYYMYQPFLSMFLVLSSRVFGSSEHAVLRASYCDRSASGVRQCVRPLTIIYKIFSSETGTQISIKLHRNDSVVMYFRNASKLEFHEEL